MSKFLSLFVVFILVASGSTFAAIVYSGSQNVMLNPMQPSMTLNIADDKINAWDDFTLISNWSSMMGGPTSLIISSGMGAMGAMGMGWIFGFSSMAPTGFPSFVATNFAAGELIGLQPFSSNSALLYNNGLGQFGELGGYIGLGMPGSSYYGWLHMSGMDNESFTFDGWAYENQPGTTIPAGAIPVPAAIGLAGIGMTIVAWLRRRKVV
jgi:hypothetical protein